MSVWIHFIKDCSPFPGCTNDAFAQTHVVENSMESYRERETERERERLTQRHVQSHLV